MIKTKFRSFDGKTEPPRPSVQPEAVTEGGEDFSRYIENLSESIEDRSELVGRLAALVESVDGEYKSPGKKTFADMQRLAEKEAQLRLLEKRIIRLTDHIRTYIDYFYTDPCPSDDPLTWGN
ncbi:MAG: hypothetical protein Q4D07_07000 [Selenomonadaceae bacterium]|nr:hypothetical protein [Selenomonadaceae bacterium]